MNKDTTQKIIDLEKKLAEAELQCKNKIRENEELHACISKFNTQRADYEALKKRNHHLEQQLLKKQIEHNKDLTEEEHLEKRIEALSLKMAQRHIEIDELKRKCSAVHELEKEVHNLEAEKVKSEDKYKHLEETDEIKIDDLEIELFMLKESLKEKEALLAALKKDRLILVSDIENTQEEESIAQKKDAEIEKLRTVYGTKISHLEKSLADLKSKCYLLKSEKNKISKELVIHTVQEKELSTKVETLEDERKLLTSEIIDLVSEKDKLQAAVTNIDNEAFRLDRNAHRLADANSHLNARIEELEKNLEHKKDLIVKKDKEIAHLKDSLEKLQHTHTELFHERNHLKAENASINKQLCELVTSHTALSNKYDAVERAYNQMRGGTIIETEKTSFVIEFEDAQKKSQAKEEVCDKRL